jgi:hypothetical protein
MSVPRFRLAQLGGGAAQPAFLTLPELGSKAPPFLLSLFRGVVRLALQVVCSDLCTRTKHGPERLGAGGNSPRALGRLKAAQSGVLPPVLGFFPTQVSYSPKCLPPRAQRSYLRHRVKRQEKKGIRRVFLTFFTALSRSGLSVRRSKAVSQVVPRPDGKPYGA